MISKNGLALICPTIAIFLMLSLFHVRLVEAQTTVVSTPESFVAGPLFIEIPASATRDSLGSLREGSNVYDLQWFDRERGIATAILPTKPGHSNDREGTVRSLQVLEKTSNSEPKVEIESIENQTRLRFSMAGKPVLEYSLITVQPPANIEAVFAHSGHIHPVYTPKGRVITAEFPADHAHQHGVFNAWVNTTFEGRKIDFWNQRERTGKVEHVRLVKQTQGPVFAEATVELLHSDVTSSQGSIPVLRDLLTIRVWDQREGFLFDIESRQICIAQSPLIINEYHYGGMAFRGPEAWLGKGKAQFLTSEGKDRIEGNHSRPRWVALGGSLEGEPCHVAVMGHHSNFRYPEPTRLHPDKPYFVFSPSFLGSFDRKPGIEHRALYRFFVTDTSIRSDVLDAISASFHADSIKLKR